LHESHVHRSLWRADDRTRVLQALCTIVAELPCSGKAARSTPNLTTREDLRVFGLSVTD